VCNFTLVRFFSLHFILPFIILLFVVLHIIFLHREGSRNPLGLNLVKKIIFFEIQISTDGLRIFIFFFFSRFYYLFFPGYFW